MWRHVCRGTGVNDPLQLVKVGGLAGASHECHRGRRLVAVAPATVATPAAVACGRLLALELAADGHDVALVAVVAAGLIPMRRIVGGIARLAIVRGDVGCGVVMWLGVGDAAFYIWQLKAHLVQDSSGTTQPLTLLISSLAT